MGSLHQSYEEFIASHRFETPTSQVRLMEAILERKNMKSAIKRVIKNKGGQIFTRIWDHTFSEYSFGFRPKRSQHDAIGKYREYVIRTAVCK